MQKSAQADAWELIQDWGHPVAVEDFGECVMFRVGDDAAFFWFEWLTDVDVLLHMAAAPSSRGLFFTRHVLQGMYWAAELFGAVNLWVVTDLRDVNEYVQRLGWEHDEAMQGWYKRIV